MANCTSLFSTGVVLIIPIKKHTKFEIKEIQIEKLIKLLVIYFILGKDIKSSIIVSPTNLLISRYLTAIKSTT